VYGLTVFFKVSRVTGKMFPAHQGNINGDKDFQWSSDETETSERQHLLSSEGKIESVSAAYGSLPVRRSVREMNFGRLEASEDRANPLSLLSFWWVGPLMRRGSLGLLQKPDDLLQLPKSLKTSKVRRRFQQVLGIIEEGMGEGSSGGTVGVANSGDAESEGNESDDSESWQNSLSVNLSGTTPSASQQIKAQEKKHKARRGIGSMSSLFWSLNRSFGIHYYPLGVLKLVADMLGFAGPLLLHALVSFMENRTVSLPCILLMQSVP
jgi:hypothetical protein